MSPSEEAQESHILEEQDTMIYTHLEKVPVHMIDEQDAQIFKSHNDYVQNKRKFLTVSKICRNMAIHISYLFIHSFSKVPQDNAGYACSLYHEYVWHTSNQS